MCAWGELLEKARQRRLPLGFDDQAAYRLLDGAGDGADGVFIDLFAGRWLVQTLSPSLPAGLSDSLRELGVPWWWKRLDQQEKESPRFMAGQEETDPFLIVENGLKFEISFRGGYSQGLFLDQRLNRLRAARNAAPGQRVLNLFAYTGGFSVAAASAGAVTTTVDLSGPYLEWAKRNFTHNGLDPAQHYFAKGDALDWLGAFAKKQRLFDGIILDPPTFSRVKGRGIWRVETDYHALVTSAVRVLQPGGWMLCSGNCRAMDPRAFENHVMRGFAAAGRKVRIESGGMPPDFTGEQYLLNVWCS